MWIKFNKKEDSTSIEDLLNIKKKDENFEVENDQSLQQSIIKKIKQNNPVLVIGTGGYSAGIPLFCANLLKID